MNDSDNKYEDFFFFFLKLLCVCLAIVFLYLAHDMYVDKKIEDNVDNIVNVLQNLF